MVVVVLLSSVGMLCVFLFLVCLIVCNFGFVIWVLFVCFVYFACLVV